MIEVIPSIQIIGGKCIRLRQGDYSSEKIYDENPLKVAQIFEDSGLKKIHLIDLDGARTGKVVNYSVLQMIAGYTDLIIDFSGGVTTDGDIGKAYEYGANTVTVGSVAVKDKELFTSWIFSYGREKIILGADASNEKIAVSGWQKGTGIDLLEHIEYYIDRSIKYIKCSDILRDGVLQGPNFDLYSKIIKKFPDIKLYASGGISCIDDIKKLEDLGVHGVIFGRSYYEGKIKLDELAKFGK
jgi:phosphoribosylformimino-5-aminoimidazole carboxamide ribotide isomerase